MKKRIGVIGSINTDFVCKTTTLPQVGETVTGEDFIINHGGKGANEAVACARLGASVNILSCVGDDMFSKNSIANLLHEGVHVTAIEQIKNCKGGIANINLCNGNNQIIVIPGANAKLDVAYIKKYSSRLLECSIVGCQFEVSTKALLYASRICKDNNIPLVLNPSPIKEYSQELFDNATYVIVNELEIAHINGYNPINVEQVLKQYPNKLILTLGANGVKYFDGNNIVSIPAIKTKVVDTTGAGDTFLGAFMVAINNQLGLSNAILFANISAGLKTTKLGAQTGMPTLTEVKNYIKKNKINLDISF